VISPGQHARGARRASDVAVRGGSAKELANALTFTSRLNFLPGGPDAGSNMLLLSGTKAALDDATTVLREIRRPARSVMSRSSAWN